MAIIDRTAIDGMYRGLPKKTRSRLDLAANMIIKTKEEGGKVVAVERPQPA